MAEIVLGSLIIYEVVANLAPWPTIVAVLSVGVVFTRNAFTIDTVRMRMYALLISGKTRFGTNFGVCCRLIRRSPGGPYSLKHA
jgi:hypothetical protein